MSPLTRHTVAFCLSGGLLASAVQAAPEKDSGQASPPSPQPPSLVPGSPDTGALPASVLEQIASGDFRSKATEDRARRAQAAAAYTLGQQAESEDQLGKALLYYQQAAGADPDYLPITARIAYIYLRQERNAEAKALLIGKIASSPDNASLRSLLAFTCLQEGDQAAAEKEAMAAWKLDPSMPSNYRLLTQIYREQQRRDAIETLRLESLNAVKSDKADTYLQLGDLWATLLVENSTPLLAARLLPFYSKALELDPDNEMAMFKLGNIELELEHYPRAVELLQKACDANDRFPQIRERLSLAFLGNHQDKEAADVLEKLVIEQPERVSLYPLLGELYERSGQLAKAEENYRMTVNLGQANAEDYINLARVQLMARREDEALKTLAEAQSNYPGMPHIALLQAYAFRAQSKFKDALAAFRRAEALAGKDSAFLSSDFYFQYAMNVLGYMWAEEGRNLPEAEKLILQALTFEPGNPAYQDSLGWVYFQQGRYDEAGQWLAKALQKMPDDSVVNDHMGDNFLKLGRVSDAVAHWEKAVPQASNPESIRFKIQSNRPTVAGAGR